MFLKYFPKRSVQGGLCDRGGYWKSKCTKKQAVTLGFSYMLVTIPTEQQHCRSPREAKTKKAQGDRCSELPVVWWVWAGSENPEAKTPRRQECRRAQGTIREALGPRYLTTIRCGGTFWPMSAQVSLCFPPKRPVGRKRWVTHAGWHSWPQHQNS